MTQSSTLKRSLPMQQQTAFDPIFEWFRIVAVVAAAFWGVFTPIDQILFSLIILDMISGLLAAGNIGSISSAIGYVKARKKAMILVILGAAHIVDPYTASLLGSLPIQVSTSSAVAAFFAINELVSIIENADALGVPIPPFLRSALEKVRSSGNPPGSTNPS